MKQFFAELLAICLCAGFMIGVYLVGRHEGYAKGVSECHSASLQSQLMAANKERANLKAQLANRDAAQKESADEINAIGADNLRLQGLAHAIPFRADCRFPSQALRLLNAARGQ